MTIPQYWAEARLRQRAGGKQVTLRRFGWSDESQEAAQAHADTRVQQAMAEWNAGKKLERREMKRAYNGGQGLPIREEVISRHGEVVITRNLYGARCLNTPNVLFADIDFEERRSVYHDLVIPLSLVTAIVVGLAKLSFSYWILTFIGMIVSLLTLRLLWSGWMRLFVGTPEKRSYKRIAGFARRHPDWHLRLYRTPAGFRLLAIHRLFSPDEPAVMECFRQLGVDRLYARMCMNQQCFRARVSPKPWRIGITHHLKPRPGVWPIRPERMPERQRWVDDYERRAKKYAACEFIEALGAPTIDPQAQAVQVLHDEMCRGVGKLRIA